MMEELVLRRFIKEDKIEKEKGKETGEETGEETDGEDFHD